MKSNYNSDQPAFVEGEINVLRLWTIVWSGRYIVLLCGFLSAATAAAYSLWVTPLYRAEVVVTEAGDGGMNANGGLTGQLGGLASLAGVNMSGSEISREAAAILESRALVEEFVKRNNLTGVILSQDNGAGSLWHAVTKFRSNIVAIRKDARKGTTTVTITWRDPALSAQWANDLVRLANEIMRNRTLVESTKNLKYLNDQIARTNVVEIRASLYGLLESETKKTMLASGRDDYAFRIVDPAVTPEVRVSPRRTMMVVLGLLLGLCGGLILIFLTGALRKLRMNKSRVLT